MEILDFLDVNMNHIKGNGWQRLKFVQLERKRVIMNIKEATDDMCFGCIHYPCYALKHNDACMGKRILIEALEKIDMSKKILKETEE